MEMESGLFGPENGFRARFLHGSKRLTYGYENETMAGISLESGRTGQKTVIRFAFKRGANFCKFSGLF